MEKFYLELPSIGRKNDALEYIEEFYEYGSEIHGTGIKENEYVYIPADSQKMYDELKKWVESYSAE